LGRDGPDDVLSVGPEYAPYITVPPMIENDPFFDVDEVGEDVAGDCGAGVGGRSASRVASRSISDAGIETSGPLASWKRACDPRTSYGFESV